MDTYTLEAGRAIRRNGLPFVSIAGCSRESPSYAPADFDTFARAVVAMPAALAACADLIGSHYESMGYATAPAALRQAWAALELLPKQEG